MAKAILYPMRARKVSLKPVRNTLWIIYLFTEAKNLVKHMSILKETGCEPLLARTSSDSIICLIRVITDMTLPTHRKLYSDIFTHERGSVSWCVFYTAQNLQAKLHCWACIFGPDDKSSVFLPVKTKAFQPQNCQKNTLDHFHYSKNFGWASEFFERNRLLATLCWEFIRLHSFLA